MVSLKRPNLHKAKGLRGLGLRGTVTKCWKYVVKLMHITFDCDVG